MPCLRPNISVTVRNGEEACSKPKQLDALYNRLKYECRTMRERRQPRARKKCVFTFFAKNSIFVTYVNPNISKTVSTKYFFPAYCTRASKCYKTRSAGYISGTRFRRSGLCRGTPHFSDQTLIPHNSKTIIATNLRFEPHVQFSGTI